MTTAIQRNFSTKEYNQLKDYLGQEFLDDWNSLDSFARIQINQRRPAVERALFRIDHRFSALFPFAVDAVEKVREEILWGFDLLLKKGQFPSENQFHELIEIYEAAIDAADAKLEIGEAIPMISLMEGAASVKGVGLDVRIRQLHQIRSLLERMKSEAEFLKLESEIQQAFGFVLNLFTLIPGVGWATKIGLTAVDYLVDNHLGADKKGIAGQIDDPLKGMSAVLDTLEKSKAIGSKTKSYMGKGGKVITVAGFAIDYIEVQQASDLLKRIKNALADAKREYQLLEADLIVVIRRLERMRQFFKDRLAPSYRIANQKIWDRDDLMKDFGYPRFSQFSWKFQQPVASR